MIIKKLKKLKFIIFIPIFIYLGERSFVAYDEGYYVLQSKWMIDSGNWLVPLWFDKVIFDRTIGIQIILAISQKIFGETNFGVYLPIYLSAFAMLYLTYSIHKELLSKKYAILSPLILSTTFLWINYVNMATQDILFATITTFGIYSSIKYSKTNKKIFLFFSGIWIGLGFMLKTYLILVPLLAIFIFLIRHKIIYKNLFWFGLIIGFTPFLIWSFFILKEYGYDTYNGLFEKLLILSKKNNFTNPFYYYLWNFPINTFPWSLFSILGLVNSYSIDNKTTKYFLFFYPLIILIALSLFSTKTQYYPIQILSLTSINCYLGILYIQNNRNIFTRFIKFFNFVLIPTISLVALYLLNSNQFELNLSNLNKNFISLGLILFSTCWFGFNFLKINNHKIISIIMGPYLLFILIFQSGIITDRSKELRLASINLINQENLNNKYIETIKSNISTNEAHAKIIKILLLMPKNGKGIENLEDLGQNKYAWTTISNNELEKNKNIQIISDKEIFKPWKLVFRN